MLKSIHPGPSSSKASSLVHATNTSCLELAIISWRPILMTPVWWSPRRSQVQLLDSAQFSNLISDHRPRPACSSHIGGLLSASECASSLPWQSFFLYLPISHLALDLCLNITSSEKLFHSPNLPGNLFHYTLILPEYLMIHHHAFVLFLLLTCKFLDGKDYTFCSLP